MTRRKWKTGEVCEHGSLGRVCPICERDEEIAELREEQKLLLDLLKAAREWRSADQTDDGLTGDQIRAFCKFLDACSAIKTEETP